MDIYCATNMTSYLMFVVNLVNIFQTLIVKMLNSNADIEKLACCNN